MRILVTLEGREELLLEWAMQRVFSVVAKFYFLTCLVFIRYSSYILFTKLAVLPVGFQIYIISFTQELVRNAHFQTPPRPTEPETLEIGRAICVLTICPSSDAC